MDALKQNLFIYCRTKWKRQNQLRLEQLRHHSSLDKELMNNSTTETGSPQNTSMSCCPTSFSTVTQSTCNFLTSAAAAALFRNAGYVHGCQL